MGKEKIQRIKIIAPVGELPSPDKELRRRLDALPKDAPLSKIFQAIDEWEEKALVEFRKMERTQKSGVIDPTTAVDFRVLRIS